MGGTKTTAFTNGAKLCQKFGHVRRIPGSLKRVHLNETVNCACEAEDKQKQIQVQQESSRHTSDSKFKNLPNPARVHLNACLRSDMDFMSSNEPNKQTQRLINGSKKTTVMLCHLPNSSDPSKTSFYLSCTTDPPHSQKTLAQCCLMQFKSCKTDLLWQSNFHMKINWEAFVQAE